MAKGTPWSRSGFTLTELLISVVIISVGVVGFASAVGLASMELWYGQRDTAISMLVADQLETLKASHPDSVQAGQRVEGDYSMTWEVVGNSPKRVRLVVSYRGHSGLSRADTLVTYLRR